MIYRGWLYYYLFIKNLYKKRWKDMNSSVFGIAGFCIFIIILFFFELSDYIFDLGIINSILHSNFPLSIAGFIAAGIIGVLLYLTSLFLKPKVSYQSKKQIIMRVKKIERKYTLRFLYLVFIFFICILIMTIILNEG